MERKTEIAGGGQVGNRERRGSRRSKVQRKVLVCPADPRYREEVEPTENFGRGGFYFVTAARHYYVGMQVSLVAGYEPNDPCNARSLGEIVRIDKLKDDKLGIAIRVLLA